MKVRININKLSDITSIIMDERRLIKETQNILKNDIEKISECYKGKDADLIKQKYIEEVNNIDSIVETLEEYISYFKWLTGSYQENLNKASSNLSSINEESINYNDTLVNNIEGQTFNLNILK